MDPVGLGSIRLGRFIPVRSWRRLVGRRVARVRVALVGSADYYPAGGDVGAGPETGRDRNRDCHRRFPELHVNLGSRLRALFKPAEVESEDVGELMLVDEVDPFLDEVNGDLARVERGRPFGELERDQLVPNHFEACGVHVTSVEVAEIEVLSHLEGSVLDRNLAAERVAIEKLVAVGHMGTKVLAHAVFSDQVNCFEETLVSIWHGILLIANVWHGVVSAAWCCICRISESVVCKS